MKILILNYEFPPVGGGGGVATHKLAKGLVNLGNQVDYITSLFEGQKRYEIVDGINVFRVKVLGRKDLATASIVSMLFYLMTGFFKACALCRKNKYDFVNTQFVVPTGPLGHLVSKIFKLKNILSIHGGDIYDPSKKSSPHQHWFLRKIITFLFNRADRIVAQSSNTQENAIKYYRPKKKINIIPLAYEKINFRPEQRSSLGLSDDKKYIIGVGRLVKRKGFEYFVKALKYLDNQVEGIIIGDGPEKENLINLGREIGVERRLHLPGFVKEEVKFQYLAASDIYVLSSLHEGFGIVLQEAMQVGLPIVATDQGGQVDLIQDRKNGLLTKVTDEIELANKIKELLDSKELREEISARNLQAVNNFSLESIAQQYIRLLN